MAHPVIRTNRWTRLSKALRAQWRAQGAVCHLCELPIRPNEPMDVDHLVPVKVAPHRAYDLMNLAPAHASCNRRKGGRVEVPEVTGSRDRPVCDLDGERVLVTTRRWFGDPGTCLRLGNRPCPSICPAATLVAQVDQA